MRVKKGRYEYTRTYGAETVEIVIERYPAGTWWVTAYYLVPIPDRIGYSEPGKLAFSKPAATKKEALAIMRDELRKVRPSSLTLTQKPKG